MIHHALHAFGWMLSVLLIYLLHNLKVFRLFALRLIVVGSFTDAEKFQLGVYALVRSQGILIVCGHRYPQCS